MGKSVATRHAASKGDRRFAGQGAPLSVAVAVLLALSGGLVFTWPRLQTFTFGYAISQLESRRTKLINQQGALLIEVESLRALRRIAQIARDELAMHPPEPGRVVLVDFSRAPTQVAASKLLPPDRFPPHRYSRGNGTSVALPNATPHRGKDE